MSATIKYKGTTLASITTNASKTLKTSGKYCEGDIVVENVQDGGITPTGNKAITATTSTQTDIDVTNYATVSVAPTPSETKSTTVNGDVTPSSGKLLSKVTVNVPTGTARSASDLTVSGATVTVPAGLYSAQATKSVASGSAGTPSATKGTISNNSVTVTPSVTNTTGYITGGTKTGTGVTVSASELVSGNKALTPSTTAHTNIDVKNYATASVAAITKELLASLDADFVAENIKKDVDLFGLLGTLEGGGAPNIVSGTFTPTGDGKFEIEHNLGSVPNFWCIYATGNVLTNYSLGLMFDYFQTGYDSSITGAQTARALALGARDNKPFYKNTGYMQVNNAAFYKSDIEKSISLISKITSPNYLPVNMKYLGAYVGTPSSSNCYMVSGVTYNWIVGVI